ncbi:hypothetical protein BR93DRAFT_394454 [Coniochaeta sp. PMI_546]|nr:hypothetical protein BR93DRAFT_394454 [Coniochaeta sp. PMI_546]
MRSLTSHLRTLARVRRSRAEELRSLISILYSFFLFWLSQASSPSNRSFHPHLVALETSICIPDSGYASSRQRYPIQKAHHKPSPFQGCCLSLISSCLTTVCGVQLRLAILPAYPDLRNTQVNHDSQGFAKPDRRYKQVHSLTSFEAQSPSVKK